MHIHIYTYTSAFLTTRPFLDHVFPSRKRTLLPGRSSGSSFPEDGEFPEATVGGLLCLDGLDEDGHLSVMEGKSVYIYSLYFISF